MKVTVRYFGQLRQIANVEQEECSLTGDSSLIDVLADRAKSYGETFHRIIFDEDQNLRPSIIVLVDGAAIHKNNPPALNDGNEIDVLTAIAGG